jgi:hypothetical protein
MGEGNKGGGRSPGSLESCGGPVCLPNLTDLETFLTDDSEVMEGERGMAVGVVGAFSVCYDTGSVV